MGFARWIGTKHRSAIFSLLLACPKQILRSSLDNLGMRRIEFFRMKIMTKITLPYDLSHPVICLKPSDLYNERKSFSK
ncbi:MAG TPA: hypothetical protein VI603_06445 [Saprospiraceae bacterium]|nr:hypothetical protein [Saprospiraceae bacterium]